jgi:[ribosomal protein S18]-alanine N-acetyltransferase
VNAMEADRLRHDHAGPEPGAVVTITPMRRRHLRSVMRIEAQAVHRGWSVGLYLAELRRERDRVYLVAKTGTAVVGYAGLLLQGDDAHVTTIGVDEGVQGRRIGSRLLLVLVDEARRLGAVNLTLEVRATNDPAVRLYRRFGLAPAGIRKNYYADIGEDALIMWAHDIDTPAYAERLDTIRTDLASPSGASTIILEGFDQ